MKDFSETFGCVRDTDRKTPARRRKPAHTTGVTDKAILDAATKLFPRWREDIQERFVLEVGRAVLGLAGSHEPAKPDAMAVAATLGTAAEAIRDCDGAAVLERRELLQCAVGALDRARSMLEALPAVQPDRFAPRDESLIRRSLAYYSRASAASHEDRSRAYALFQVLRMELNSAADEGATG